MKLLEKRRPTQTTGYVSSGLPEIWGKMAVTQQTYRKSSFWEGVGQQKEFDEGQISTPEKESDERKQNM